MQVETSLLQLEGGNIKNEVPIIGLNDKFYLDRGKFDNITRKRFVLSSAGIGENCHIICQEKDMQVSTDNDSLNLFNLSNKMIGTTYYIVSIKYLS